MNITDIAGYRVVRQLGAGAMGQVFLVQHPRLPRQDALKLLDSGVSRNDDFRARFQREADLLAQLSHPNIVTLYDRGEFEGRLWITMEYVAGNDAADLLRAGGPLHPDLAIQLVSGAGAALDYAWRKQQITHRDVKPANILVGIDESDGEPQIESAKLADFGIAKAAGEATSLTSTGITIGTMQYISPEAIEGEDLGNRADIYSLGCTAFHLLTGQPPYSGKSITALMKAHLTQVPPKISEVAPLLPEALDIVFAKVLAKHPADRHQSCAEFVKALQDAAGGADSAFERTMTASTFPGRAVAEPSAPTELRKVGDVPNTRTGTFRTTVVLAAVAAVLALVAASLGAYLLTRDGSDTAAARATSSTVPIVTTPSSASAVATTGAMTTKPTVKATRTAITTTIAAAPTPYEGMPCTQAEFNRESADGTLFCSALTGSWRDKTHQSRPAVKAGAACTEPGARARVAQTDGIATCKVGPAGGLIWSW